MESTPTVIQENIVLRQIWFDLRFFRGTLKWNLVESVNYQPLKLFFLKKQNLIVSANVHQIYCKINILVRVGTTTDNISIKKGKIDKYEYLVKCVIKNL